MTEMNHNMAQESITHAQHTQHTHLLQVGALPLNACNAIAEDNVAVLGEPQRPAVFKDGVKRAK